MARAARLAEQDPPRGVFSGSHFGDLPYRCDPNEKLRCVEMETAFHDALYAVRRLRRSPGFSAAALLTLALGIGANALIFSVVNAVFLRPLLYRDANRLVWATEFFPKFNRAMVPAPDYAAWKRQNTTFERLEAMGPTFGRNLTSAGRPAERVETAHVTPGFFAMLGTVPRLGAGFDPMARPGGHEVAIVSNALWRGYLQADPAVVGKSVTLDGKPLTIVGVTPPAFIYPDGADVALWLPDAVPPAATVPGRNPDDVRLIGRLKPKVTIEQARAELERITRGMDDQYPAPFGSSHAAARVRVLSLQKQLAADSTVAAGILMGAVAFLLLIACGNVANLFLARAVARRKEIAMRMAVGAARSDIVRMLLTECVLVGALGGSLGFTFLLWGRGAVKFLIPKTLAQGIPIDWRVLAFTVGCSLTAGLVFGMTPAIIAVRGDVNSGLKDSIVHSGGRLAAFLSSGQIALSLVLLAGAGLMIRSFVLLASSDPGFDARNVLTATAMLRPFEAYGPERQVDFFDRILAGIEKLPGVRFAAVTSSPPMTQFSEIETGLHGDDGPKTDDIVSITSISPKYFPALGIRLLAGRFFDARDRRDGTPVAILNESLARLLFQGRRPLGHRINSAVTVVGVVADTRHRALDDRVWPEMFLPFEQSPSPWITVLVRGAGDPSSLAPAIRRLVLSVDSSQPLFDVGLLEQRVSDSLAERRERATILGAFASLALLIAAVGIYAVMSCSVARRTHEIGIRMALGAQRGDVLRMVVGDGLRIAACGTAVGLAGALYLTRVLKTFLYGLKPTDLATLCVVCATLLAAAFLASYLPARRAAAVNPVVALRRE
jgi:putative ABC transport system permease protein